jgi:PadR family transcriptional regulator, regulatory protein PadR
MVVRMPHLDTVGGILVLMPQLNPPERAVAGSTLVNPQCSIVGRIALVLPFNRGCARVLLSINMAQPNAEVPYGTLDLMVLKTLAALGPLHGYGVARRIEQVAEGSLALNQGTIYPALLRLEQKGWIKSDWGTSENNRRARFYSITSTGKRHLVAEADSWARTVSIVNRLLATE